MITKDQLTTELGEVADQLTHSTHNQALMAELGQKYNKLARLKELFDEIEATEKQLAELAQINEPEMMEMVASEQESLTTRLAPLQHELKIATLAELPDDEKACIIEVRAGTGGTEAALFAEELLRMYTKYCQKLGWIVELSDTSYDAEGGIKSATLSINTKGSFARLRFEAGVHRVQRVPATEASGRIHTSTASVAVLAQLDDVKVVIADKDIRVDVYRSSGPGGQSVNTTDSAVRITHIPSGIVVTCQESKSQLKNKEKAMSVLAAKLYALQVEEAQKAQTAERREMIKTGDRSAKIRTYNFPQSRITDHRIKQTWFNINEILEGYLDEVIDAIQEYMRS